MTNATPRVRFADYLPEVFVTGGSALIGTDAGREVAAFLQAFLAPFESLFEELQAKIEGRPAAPGTIPRQGGIPDLFAWDQTPPAQFAQAGVGLATGADAQAAASARAYQFLSYLADWTGIALRPERSVAWNRQFLGRALALNLLRGTSAGLDALLRAWLSGDLLQTTPPALILTDLTRTVNEADTAFQLDVTSVLGVQTVLGEGPPFFFVVDLIADPAVRVLRNPVGLDVLQRAARSLLAAEKPAHTYYQLRIRATTMQLAPADPVNPASPAPQVAAVDCSGYNTDVRVYLNGRQEIIQEYRGQSGGQWAAGAALRGALPDTRVAAAQWLDTSKAAHVRVYYQTTNGIVEQCYDPPNWYSGKTFTGVQAGAGIAALAWTVNGETHLRLYYQNTSYDIVEQCYDGWQGWTSGRTFPGAQPGTGIAAVLMFDETNKRHQRLYYGTRQDANDVLIEQCYDDGTWTAGRIFYGVRPQTAIAAVQWFESGDRSGHVRLYYQDPSNDIVEQCYDTPDWAPGYTFTGAAEGTGIAGLKVASTGDLRVCYEDISRTVIEQRYSGGKWTPGGFTAPMNQNLGGLGEIYAQLEDAPALLGTALLWDDAWVFNSDPESAAG